MNSAKRRKLDPVINCVRLGTLTSYEIMEYELEALERGSPESIFLNLCIAVFSTAISFTIAIFTTTIESLKTFSFFVMMMLVGYLAGITFLILWWKSRTSVKRVGEIIRARKVPEGVQENPDSD